MTCSKRGKAILLFGTFNPFTMAHLHMGLTLKSEYSDADIIYVPSTDRFIEDWKKYGEEDIFVAEQRVKLIEDAICDSLDFYVSRVEIDGISNGKTYNTVACIKEEYDEVYISMGMDKLEELSTWYRAEELVKENRFIMFTRNQQQFFLTDFIRPYADRFTVLEDRMGIYDGISATMVRDAYRENRLEEVKWMLPENVYLYLANNREHRKMDYNKVKNDIVVWIRDWFKENGDGCKAVIGVSGGKDSSVVTALCVEALGKERVYGVLMPCGVQSDIRYSLDLVEFLGIDYSIINIEDAVKGVENSLMEAGIEMSEQTKINLPPRIRMSTLYAVSQSMNGRVSNNCNLSEDWVGYSTRWGDSVGDFSPLCNLTVTEVREIGRALGLPKHIIEKAPSDGLCGKTDEDNLGFTYEVLDKYIREGVIDDPETKKIIDKKHANNLFKLKPVPSFKQTIQVNLQES